ncbi:CRISPR-associated endonuclease/helicase Cas3 [Rhodoblastus sphagnicola]|nr:CRISPR-associated endonuclease/helicase Cas3 [Rhodoblastus sphagnicola]
MDVAACAEALLSRPMIRLRLAALAGEQEFLDIWGARLAALAFLHDFGKANRDFQSLKGGHIAEAAFVASNAKLRQAAGLNLLESWLPGDIQALLAVALAHHGAPPDFDRLPQCDRAWSKDESRDPVGDVRALVNVAQNVWPEAFVMGGAPLPEANSPFWHGYLGLLQLADWLGSDEAPDAFPFSTKEDGSRLAFARRRATDLIDRIGFNSTPQHKALPDYLEFSRISAHPPSEIQLAAADAPGPVVVLEAETGAGKTEAALWRFARLFAEGKVDSLYFALPTRVAASQIHGRVQEAAKRLFGSEAPEVLRALPGDVRMDDASGRRLPGFAMQWNDDPDEAIRRSRWAAEQPKRFLAATIAVGTIDQALLGAVCLKHAQMRGFCLSRSLLVVDEVHASDAYMEKLLVVLLEQHARFGGEALLLSATLGAAARARLILGARRAREAIPAPTEAAALAYPSLAWRENGELRLVGKASRGRVKDVSIEPLKIIADPGAIAQRALAAAESGARVLVVRNTVRDAVATARVLEAVAPDHPALFRLDQIVTLHHGRFARGDRWRLDAEVEQRIGKTAEARPLVLVGTQTLEQSLDIDADLLITDLAPMDVLLQRVGRLHRHDRRRPPGFEAARALVLTPEDFEPVLRARDFRGPHGLGGVYENLLALAATREAIGCGAHWTIPQMNRALVEAATHPVALEELEARLSLTDARWSRASMNHAGGTLARNAAAQMASIDWHTPVIDFRLADEKIGTRLGLGDTEIEFETPQLGPFLNSEAISRLLIPSHLMRGGSMEAKAVDIAACDDGFTFSLQETVFRYSRFGLEKL